MFPSILGEDGIVQLEFKLYSEYYRNYLNRCANLKQPNVINCIVSKNAVNGMQNKSSDILILV